MENLSHPSMMPKKSKGRQKIQMTRMEKESNLLVTFSKRRSGLFKKASELCILCGVEIAIVVFSPGKKVFSFGHPSVEMIVNRFLTQNPSPSTSSTSQLVEAHRHANIHGLNRQLTFEISSLEAERNKSEHLNKIRKAGQENNWWEAPIETLGLEELEHLKVAMGLLKKNIEEHKKRHWVRVPANPMPGASGSTTSMGISGEYTEMKGSGLGLSMTPNGFVLGYDHHNH